LISVRRPRAPHATFDSHFCLWRDNPQPSRRCPLVFGCCELACSFFLSFANLALIYCPGQPGLFKLVHSAILLLQISLAIFLFNFRKFITDEGKFGQVVSILAIGIPLIVMIHFVYLLIYRRRFKHKIKKDA
jgi:hypothetical protein